MHDRKHQDCHCLAPALSHAAQRTWVSVRAVMLNKLLHETKPKIKFKKEHVAQRDVANQKVLKTALYLHCIHGDYHRSITACFIYYSAPQLSKDSVQDISRELLSGGVFFPLQRKIIDLVLFLSPQKFCYEAKCFKPHQPKTNLI